MAEVFRARAAGARPFERELAIKRILPGLARHPEFEERFLAEARLGVTLAHPNIVRVFDFGRLEGSLYLAMEYLDGPDVGVVLEHFARREAQLPVAAALYIGMELCRGLEFAHCRGVVHRDVSP